MQSFLLAERSEQSTRRIVYKFIQYFKNFIYYNIRVDISGVLLYNSYKVKSEIVERSK